MRLASSLLISLSIHAVALSFSVSFLRTEPEPVVLPVIVLGEDGDGREGVAGKSGVERSDRGGVPAARRHLAATDKPKDRDSSHSGSEEDVTMGIPSELFVTQASFESGPITGSLRYGSEGAGNSSGQSGLGGRGEGTGGSESAGSGRGSGGLGGEGGEGGFGFIRVSYAYNPRPMYPEAARREGWEGTAVVRVLVDQEGKSRSVEVNRSSGFDALDRAALEAVQSWRFHPAHYGQRRVESWVKIPIVFSLAELRN